MPILCDNLAGEERPDVVGWLRFITEEGDTSAYAALFQTTSKGQPLAFCFARVDRSDPSLGHDAQSILARSLFRFPAQTPSLLLALTDEFPYGILRHDLRLRLPCCLITPALPDNGRPLMDWFLEPPHDEEGAGNLLDAILARQNPLAAFERAASALGEAFADERVQALTSVHGLVTVVDLIALPDHLTAEDSPTGEVSPDEPPDGRTLPERMWAALASPAETGYQGWDFQLEWPGTLMPFQQDGVRALLDNQRLLLADDMGLGKTLQAIAAVRILQAQRKTKSCLVVAPAGLLDQWRREFGKWAPELSAIIVRGSASDRSWQWASERDVTLVSYDTLRSDFSGNALAPVRRRTWDVVVADEAQRIKNRNDTSDALKGLQRTRSWALTGTPIENHEEELASILEFVDHDASEEPKRYQSGETLRTRHRELQLRRRKNDVLDDLPPKQVTMTPIELYPSQRRSYEKAEQEGIVYLKSLGSEVTIQHVFALLTRLKQICNADPRTGESSKLDDIRDRMEQLTAQGHKGLVFSQYIDESSGVAAAVRHLRAFSPLSISGDMSPADRQAAISRFKVSDNHKVLVLSLRAGGLGLNLQEASYVFHLDRWWNPAVERQAEDRSHRIGQTVKVNVIKYSCVGTIEERIDKVLEHKQGLFDQLIDDVSLDLSAQLNREELWGLFGL